MTVSENSAVIRFGGALCCLWLLFVGWFAWVFGGGYENLTGSVISFIIYTLFFVVGVETFRRDLHPRYPLHVLLAVTISLIGYTYVLIHYRSPEIQTDGLVLSLAAAQSALHGHNPYTEDLGWAYARYHLQSTLGTPLANGSIVSKLPYPALAFLLYVPTELTHVDARWISLAALLAAIGVVFWLAPAYLKTLAPLVFFIDPNYVEYMIGSVQDIDYVVPLLLAAFFWTDLPVLAGLCLGFASAIKQEPWLDIPFFLVGVAASSRTGGATLARVSKAAAGIAIAFMVPNAYYALSAPSAWAGGVFEPFTAKHVEFGVGLVTFALTGLAQIPHALLTALAVAAFSVLLILAYRYFSVLRNALWLAPAFSLFLAPRSLENYIIYVVPVCLASWMGELPDAMRWKRGLITRWMQRPIGRLLASGALAISCCLFFGCAHRAAVHSEVRHVYDTGDVGLANSLDVAVRNDTDRPIEATYLVAWTSWRQFLWRCRHNCSTLEPHSSQLVRIQATDYATAVPNGATGLVRVVDKASMDEYQSERFVVRFPAMHLFNPCLCVAKDVGYTVPVGWTISQAAFGSGAARYQSVGPHRGLTLTVKATALPGWSTASAYQNFVPFERPIAAMLSKTVIANGGPGLNQYAGVSIADENGHFELFTWADVSTTRVFKQKGIFVLEPASRPGNRLTVDFERYRELAGFDSGAALTIRLVVAAKEPKRDMSATFSGFDVTPAENRLNGTPSRPQPQST